MILDAIYHGEFHPEELRTNHCLRYTQACKATCKLQHLLQEKTDAETYSLIEKLLEQTAIANTCECEMNFKVGFSAGLHLALESEQCLCQQLNPKITFRHPT